MSGSSPNQKDARVSIKASKNRTLVLGAGYLGKRVALAAIQAGDQVWASTRSSEKAAQLKDSGLQPVILDWTDRSTLPQIPEVDRVLVAVAYDPRSSHSRYDSQVGGFSNLLSILNPKVDVCYISTTGVYHQTDGSWVDETSNARPQRAGGKAHLDAESLLHRMRPDSPWTILRLAGIYGPQRIPRIKDIVSGRPITASPDGYLNLIHVSDAVSAVFAAWNSESEQRLFLVADDLPVVRRDFYTEIANRTNSLPPSYATAGDNAPDRMRFPTNKRIWNRRFKRWLVPQLQYPTYQAGLDDIL